MLTLLLGTDWIANRDAVLDLIRRDVLEEKGGRILLVPEMISHDAERRLCAAGGDSASRYAEVLSFTRLVSRVADAVCHGVFPCLDNGGRIVAMAAAARQLHSKLKAYASVETRPEFLAGLVEAVDEFKRCCISAQDLMAASGQSQGSLAQKLEELSLLLDAYDALCSRGARDPRDQLTWLLEQLDDSDFAAEHVFYIDGFPDFTRQQLSIIEHLICNSRHVVVSLNCDRPNSELMAFERSGQCAADLLAIAKKNGVDADIHRIVPADSPLNAVKARLFQGKTDPIANDNAYLRVYRMESVHEEAAAAAERVMELVRGGCRYRDIGVVCTDISAYRNAVSSIFNRCDIPVYLSGSEDILEKSVMITVLSALDVALSGFEKNDVLRYLRSALSGLTLEACDKLENYAVIWNITGSRWTTTWTYHPAGLNEPWSEAWEQVLKTLNQLREQAVKPLQKLQKDFRDAQCLKGQVQALCSFLESIQMAQRLAVLADEMDEQGDNRSAQILDQLWSILLSALEQMYDVLGDTVWDSDSFIRLLKLLLSQYDVGTIPTVLDAVTVGAVSTMRCHQSKHMILLGALEGSLPGYGGSTGVLSEQERSVLRNMGVPLNGGSVNGLQAEFYDIYGAFCAAGESICVSCPAGQPSFIYRRLCQLAGGETEMGSPLGMALADRSEAAAFLVRSGDKISADQLGLTDDYQQIVCKKQYALGKLEYDTVTKLYGSQLNLSASQVDKLADCRLSYFLKYGLRAKERKQATVDPAEFGTYVHAVLEQTVRKIMEMGGFRTVSLDETVSIAKMYSDAYIAEHFEQIDSQRILYLFQRNCQELELVVQELWDELQQSAFAPVGFEVGFGDSEQMHAIPIQGSVMDARLRGFVDRVDLWQDNGQRYYRVVDYKTGKKDFDYCDVFNGLGLQMLLYLFALKNEGEQLLGAGAQPAGVQYFPARVPVVSAEGVLSPEDAAREREKNWKRKGLLLRDEAVLNAMEPSESPKRLNYIRKKDGSLSGDLAESEQLNLLKEYVFILLGKMVDDIASGCVEPNPYTRGSSHNACVFCPYGEICHPDEIDGRRNYKAMSPQRFWDEVAKEVGKNG